jgi:hypothetical protein
MEVKTTKKKPNGRPKKIIDYDLVESLAEIQCTQAEIAATLKVSVKTLQRNEKFCRIYKQGMDNGKMSLRRMQWRAANKGNTTMLVWLGKQYLSQRDRIEQENKGDSEFITALNNFASAVKQ